uniref:Uncharacterized protein n=1 Tax=Arundo donax TaxID=35708 RepID=A0A0A9HF25_ARUDO
MAQLNNLALCLFPCADAVVGILSTRLSTGKLDSLVGCKVVTFKPTIVSIQVDQLIVRIRLWWSLDKTQERLHQLMILVNQNRREKS